MIPEVAMGGMQGGHKFTVTEAGPIGNEKKGSSPASGTLLASGRLNCRSNKDVVRSLPMT
jgi:hypothetical protein